MPEPRHSNISTGSQRILVQARDVYGGIHLGAITVRHLLVVATVAVLAVTAAGDTGAPALADEPLSCGGPALPRGPILDKYLAERARVGCPASPVHAVAGGQVVALHTADTRYTDRIYWSPGSGAHLVQGEIGKKWAATGSETGPLGYPTTDELLNLDQDGRRQEFQHGVIYWHPRHSRGAHPISTFFDTWAGQNHELGPLGYPFADEQPTADGGTVQHFQGGAIISHPTRSRGAHPVMIKIFAKWQRGGGEAGTYGYPIAAETEQNRVYRQEFEHGTIVWDDALQDYR